MNDTVAELPLVTNSESLVPALPGRAPWLIDLRGRGLARFREEGLPTRRTEAWKYTRLDALKKTAFLPPPLDRGSVLDTIPAGKALAVDACRVVLVNGRLAPELSDLDSMPRGLKIEALAHALEAEPETVEPYLGRFQPLEGYPFAALNTGFLGDGLVVRVREGALVERPLHIVSIAHADDRPTAFHPRLLVVAEKGSAATIVESHIGIPGGATLSNGVTEIAVAEGAVLRHYKVQNEEAEAIHFAATQAVVQARGVYETFALSFGGRLARHDIRVLLDGEEAEARVDGAYAADSGQHMDTASFIDHAVPHGRSSQTYKGVVDGNGRGVFQGRINVRRAAQCTDGRQLHKALLLSRQAEVDAKPELTIYADDVTCSHGNAVGELEEDKIFYLRSRGLDDATARALLIEGFLDDVVDAVSSETVREAMKDMVRSWLARRTTQENES